MRKVGMLGKLWTKWLETYHNLSLRIIVWVSFSVTAIAATVLMGLSFYSRFSAQLQYEVQVENQSLMNQVNAQVTAYLRNMMKVSDTLYYTVIKDKDLEENNWTESFQLLYETNKDSIKNIALFTEAGEPIVLAPAAVIKDNVDPSSQEWFKTALNRTENMHFSTPHVQNLFRESDYQYEWVISLSRAVQITNGTEVKQGVLLIDMSYEGLKQLFGSISMGRDGYVYLMDSNGELIYHPRQQLLASGLLRENIAAAADYRDGIYQEEFEGARRSVQIKTVGYTGWVIAGVTPNDAVTLNTLKSRIFFLFLFFFFIVILAVINSYLSDRVSKPIRNLELAVKQVESGNLDAQIQAEGFYEVRHLGQSVKKMAQQMKKLMQDIVTEHESKRKSELDSLQSQINPHFLYNTLDIIVWMIENERQQDASRVVTALARFFRISLSKGRNIISVGDEIEHVRNYLMIQKMRYKNRFEYTIETQSDVERYASIKLILQPLVENAIYHGMEFMDGDGLIDIRAYTQDEDLYISVADNGLGMEEGLVTRLLSGEVLPSSKGSGIGVKNVDERIRLYFGEKYGLLIESEPDVGTKILVHLPQVVYTEGLS